MSLRESQNFFYRLGADPKVVQSLRKDKAGALKKFFRSEKDRKFLGHYAFERFEVYRRHVAFGLLSEVALDFPVIRSLVSDDEWNEFLNDFTAKRLRRSPIAHDVSEEFAVYLQKKYHGPLLKKYPYLPELAHYEFLELKLLFDRNRPLPKDVEKRFPQDLQNWAPVLNPNRALRTYRWPVHYVSADYCSPRQVRPGRYSLLVYRDPESLAVRFVEPNALTADLIRSMATGRSSLARILGGLVHRHRPDGDPEIFVREALAAVRTLYDKSIILGFRRITNQGASS